MKNIWEIIVATAAVGVGIILPIYLVKGITLDTAIGLLVVVAVIVAIAPRWRRR
jgi:hypothetical protein